MSDWLRLVRGAQTIEAPFDLLKELLREFGVDASRDRTNPEIETTFDITRSGTRGSDAAGYRWKSVQPTDTNAFISCRAESYGIPGLEFDWSFSFDKSGYDYLFTNGTLRIRFGSPDDQRRFTSVWHGKVGARPEFAPITAAES